MSNCLVTGGSKEDVAPIAVLLLNVKQTQSWVDHIVVYHDGISLKDQKLMNSILPVEFVRYRFPGSSKNFNEIVRYVYTPLVFCKYECFKLLEKYDNVLWTDYDVVIQKDLRTLVLDNPTGFKSLYSPIFAEDFSFLSQIRADGYEACKRDHFDLNSVSIATGIFCLSRYFSDPGKIYRSCIQFSEYYGKYLVHPEQAVLNMVIARYQLNVRHIPWLYAVHPEKNIELVPDAFILHAYAQPKFWNGLHNDTWQKNYEMWLQMGGTPWRRWSMRTVINKILKSSSFKLYRILQKLK